jgi:branched-chain amino acid transport system ATP-binding protein
MPVSCLALDRVSREFGGLKAVDAVSLTVRPGERRAVIGPNGAGKTTLFNIISGEVPPTSGRVALFGDDVTRVPVHQRAARGLARTFQIVRVFPDLTVRDNAVLACEALDRRKWTMHRPLGACGDLVDRAERLLEIAGLAAERHMRARHLPYGDQRKLDVALSMAGRPRLLLLDEPMAGLAAGDRDAIQRLIEQLDPSMAVLLIEHDMDVAFRFAQRVTVMYQGRVLVDGSRDEVSADRRVQEIYLGC